MRLQKKADTRTIIILTVVIAFILIALMVFWNLTQKILK